MLDRLPSLNDEIEVRLQPYPGARETWQKARITTPPDERGEFMVQFLGGFTYHGSTRKMVKAGDWR